MTCPELKGETVIITGGANGIGAAMVEAFHAQGARVHFCDMDSRAGGALQEKLGDDVMFARLDLRSEAQVRRWIRRVADRSPHIRVLVNNAATDPRIPLGKMSTADWDDLFAGNLRAYFITAREVADHMRRGASIINFSSITVHTAPVEMTAYVATKGAVLTFSRSLARELGSRRIRVNTLSPGWVMTARQLREFVTPSVKRLIRRSQCIPDLIRPGEVAEVALFLASDASRAITGQEILVDRGWAHS